METFVPAARKVSPGMSTNPPSTMIVVLSPGTDKAIMNKAYCSTNDARHFTSPSGSPEGMVDVNNQIVLTVSRSWYFGWLSRSQRRNVKVSVGDGIFVARYIPKKDSELVILSLELQFVKFRGKQETLDATILEQKLTSQYGAQMMTVGQMVAFEYIGTNYIFTVKDTQGKDIKIPAGEQAKATLGLWTKDTHIMFETSPFSGIKVLSTDWFYIALRHKPAAPHEGSLPRTEGFGRGCADFCCQPMNEFE